VVTLLRGLVGGVVNALAYGVVRFVGAAVAWMKRVLGMAPGPTQMGTFLFFRPVYGTVPGAVVGPDVVRSDSPAPARPGVSWASSPRRYGSSISVTTAPPLSLRYQSLLSFSGLRSAPLS
jgi:hypothetical protein